MRKALKIAIVEKGTTQRILARDTGIAESRISAIVCGWVRPRAAERAAIATVLGVSEERLFLEGPVISEDARPQVAAAS
jgi:transcriptional regulator with XRE-family HTH domain